MRLNHFLQISKQYILILCKTSLHDKNLSDFIPILTIENKP